MSRWAEFLGENYMQNHGKFACLKDWKEALLLACHERGLTTTLRNFSWNNFPETLIKVYCTSNGFIHPQNTFTSSGDFNYLSFGDACLMAGYDSGSLPGLPVSRFDIVTSEYLWCCKRLLDVCCRTFYTVGTRMGILQGVNVKGYDNGVETVLDDLSTAYGWGFGRNGSNNGVKCNISLNGAPFNNGSGFFPTASKTVFFKLSKYTGADAYYHPVIPEMTYTQFPGNITNNNNFLYSDQMVTSGNVNIYFLDQYLGWEVESAKCICGPDGYEFYDAI